MSFGAAFLTLAAFGLYVFVFIQTLGWLHHNAHITLKKSMQEIEAMLQGTDFVLIYFKTYSWQNQHPNYGIFHEDDLAQAGLSRKNKKIYESNLEDGERIDRAILPRPFLNSIRKVKRGEYTWGQLHVDSLNCNPRATNTSKTHSLL